MQLHGTVFGCYKVGGDYITFEDLDKAFGGNGQTGSDGLAGLWNEICGAFDDTHISVEEAAAAHNLGLYPPLTPPCDCQQCDTYDYIDGSGKHRTVYTRVKNGSTEYYYDTKEHWYESSNEVVLSNWTPPSGTTPVKKVFKVGSKCEKFLKYIIKRMRKASDSAFDTYTPYIQNVTDHWYRDVYFVNDGSTDFIDYDYQYELITGERWTLYQTYTSDQSDTQNVYNPEREGEFVYYVVDTATGDYVYEDAAKTKPKIYDGNVVSGESSIGYDGKPLEDADGNPVTERLAARGEDGTIVAKKAVTLKLADNYEDLGWHKSGSRYMAYDPHTTEGTSYEQMYTPSEIQGTEDELEKNAMTNMYVEIKIAQINQTGEGLRTETNPKIKKMFLSNYYFKYDGSQARAEIIYALRDKLKNDSSYKYPGNGPINKDKDGKEITESQLTTLLETKEYNLDFSDDKFTSSAENGTYKLGDYVGNVSFQQDALNTFAMMENSHTLDADYIYRDFKELVVELGYFEKEELTKGKPKLLEWIVPIIGSAGYPNRSIDKRDEEYGTMVHSKEDIKIDEKQTILSLISGMGSELPSGLSGQQTGNTTPGAGLLSDGLIGNNDRISIQEVGSINKATKTPAQVPLSEFLDTTRKMCEEINNDGFDYCVYNLPSAPGSDKGCQSCAPDCVSSQMHDPDNNCSCTQNHCKHEIHHNECDLPTDYTKKAKPSIAKHNFCCATLVSWALQNVGVMPEKHHKDGAEELAEYITKNLKPEVIQKDAAPLEEGDILCYDGHIDIVGKKISGGFEKYNGGHQVKIGAVEYGEKSSIEQISGWPSNATCALRLNWGKGEPGVYEGYVGNEAVVSPVTGILREYGEYDAESAQENRENLDLKYGGLLEGHTFVEEITIDEETGEEIKEIKYPYDKVGYAVIEVLDAETYRKLESEVTNRWNPTTNGTSLVKINERSTNNNAEESQNINKHISFVEKTAELIDENRDWTKVEETVYAYKEFVEQYEQFGIGGYYIYIDGFKCETLATTEEEEENATNKKQPRSPKIIEPGDPLTLDSFKITEAQVNNENYEPKIENLYEADPISKLISESMYNKLKAESGIKCDASTGITFTHLDDDVDDEGNPIKVENEYILIKEGTTLGRTYTDEEIVNERDGDYGTYDEYFEYHKQFLNPDDTQNTNPQPQPPEEVEENFSSISIPLMGNYLRIIMQKDDGSIEENVEDYMKLDELDPEYDNDWELFFWLPFESGGTDIPGNGPECQGTCSTGETAVGIVQWTVLYSNNGAYHDHDMNNITEQFIPGCIEDNPTLCEPLSYYSGWSTKQFWDDWNDGEKQFQKTLTEICNSDRDAFLHTQMEVAKKQYLEPIVEKYPWVGERPSCVQGAIMHLNDWGADWSWCASYESKSDEEVIEKVRQVIDTTPSTAGPAPNNGGTAGRGYNEPQIALEILSGNMSPDDVEQWVRTKDVQYLSFDWK